MTAPTITGLTASVTFGENTVNAAPQIIDSDVTVTDAEGNFDGGTLKVTGHFGGDSIGINNQGTGAGQIGFSDGSVTFGGTVIGTATGGSAGSMLTVTFNASATTAAVEALIENLTYANSNNVNPAASRTLKIVLLDAAGEGQFVVQSGTDSPLNGVDIGAIGLAWAAPAFGDLDGDGDLDLVVGNVAGTFVYYQNTGTDEAPVYVRQTGAANPLNGVDIGTGSVPTLLDLDGDGDLDMVSTENDGVVNYFKNTGTASAPVFAEQTGAASPFNGIVPANFTKPAFADIDGDGDQDMLLGTHGGNILYYKNTGSATAPAFAQQGGAADPFAGIDPGSYTAPAFGDVDGDGDIDLIVAWSDGRINYFENTGSATAPSFVERTGGANPFDAIVVTGVPTLVDIDGDGDLDLVAGNSNGSFKVALNTAAEVKVNVFTENDAPVAQDASETVTEGRALNRLLTATDVDGTVTGYVLDSLPAKGNLTINADGRYTFNTGDAFNYLDEGQTETVTFTYHAVDNSGASSAVQTVTITVNGVNTPPTFTDLAPSITFAENTVNATPRFIDANVSVFDAEDNFSGGQLVVSGLKPAEDIVSIYDEGTGSGMIGFSNGVVTYEGIAIGTGTWGGDRSLVVTFNQNVTAAMVEQVIENLTYANTSDAPTASRVLSVGIWDAGEEYVISTITVNVTAENDAPVARDASFSVAENGTLSGSVPAATDADGTVASYVLDSGPAKGGITFNTDGSFTFDTGTAFDSLAAGQSEAVTFTYHALDDGGASSAVQTVTITVNGANDAPTLTGLVSSVTYAENAAAKIIDGSVAFTSVEGRLISSLVVKGLLAEDIVSINNQGAGSGQIGFSGGNVTYGGMSIGTATGGSGANLVVTFNANTTTAAVETLIENLTYANTSDTPTASRGLSIVVTDSTGATMGDIGYVGQTGTDNPFNGINVGANSAPAFGDLDGDGDLDMAVGVGNGHGNVRFYENTGSPLAPVFVERTGTDNPFHSTADFTGVDVALADIDGDGDLDAMIGVNNPGLIQYYKNTGSAAAPQFVLQGESDNPFSDIELLRASPAFADLDNDGDLDMAVGWSSGELIYFENTGTAAAPRFVEADVNPFAGFVVVGGEGDATPSFADVDGDGDFDVVVGEYGLYSATLAYLENIGTAETPNFVARSGDANPFSAITSGYRSRPALADLDGDGQVDLALGDRDGGVAYYKGSGSKAGVTVNVTAENDAPVAADDARSTDEDTMVAGTVDTSDIDGSVVSHALVSGVAKGELTFLEDGSWSFDPDGHFDGLDNGESEQVSFTYRATDNDGAQSAAKTVTITVNGVSDSTGGGTANRAPTISSASAYTVAENATSVGKVTATDADGQTLSFAIAGGADASLFRIDAKTGALSFKAAPDYEEPADANHDNAYQVMVRASDGKASDTHALTVKVSNVGGVTIKGGKKKDTVSTEKTVKGQAMATGEEDVITGKGKNDKLSGLGGNDHLNGGSGKDKLIGGDGDDRLIGGKQNDKLFGGLGEDSFVFNTKFKDNVDTVKDFQAGIDAFVLDDKVFKKLSPGPLAVEEFVIGKTAKDHADHIIYNQKNGQLLYDVDGKGGKDAVLFAKTSKGLDLDAGDFLVI